MTLTRGIIPCRKTSFKVLVTIVFYFIMGGRDELAVQSSCVKEHEMRRKYEKNTSRHYDISRTIPSDKH